MAADRQTPDLGPLGESLAARFVEGLEWRVLARNYRARGGEIDLVAEDQGEIVFIEVKTQSQATLGEPEDRVAPVKQRRLARAALQYAREKRLDGRAFRFDVVAIVMTAQGPRVSHYRDAFNLPRGLDG
ncbi:MAG TPA: YraN family protein [Candidatus Brocadiia bacterium]|nr:YraN family protein [Candidatus Brocadiia bacterium]